MAAEILCQICRVVRFVPTEDQTKRACPKCDALLHKWNRKLYSSTPVIR